MSEELHLHADVESDPTTGFYRYDRRARTVRINAVVNDGPADTIGRWIHVDIPPALLADMLATALAEDDAAAGGQS